MRITRGLGGRKGVLVLMTTVAVGLVLIGVGWFLRERAYAPRSVERVALPREEVLRLQDKARGPMQELIFVPHDMARVASYAVGKTKDGKWDGLPDGTVLLVKEMVMEGGEPWVRAEIQGGVRHGEVLVHASFLERYLPIVLDKTIEFSDMRLVHVAERPLPQMAVTGWLRNITSRTISQCVVTCVFTDKDGREVDIQRTKELVLPPLELVHFASGTTKKEGEFKSISIQITHATPDGLRNYLSTIVVQRSSLSP